MSPKKKEEIIVLRRSKKGCLVFIKWSHWILANCWIYILLGFAVGLIVYDSFLKKPSLCE